MIHRIAAKGIGSQAAAFLRSIPGPIAAPALLITLLLTHAASVSEGSQEDPTTPLSPPDSSGAMDVLPGSGVIPGWDENGDYEEFTPAFHSESWDSVMAAYDASVKKEAIRRISPEFGVRYTKAEGIHPEGGFTLGWRSALINRMTVVGGYDTGRERPAARGDLEICIPWHDRMLLRIEGQSGILPFGNHDPYGATLMALIAGYDARNYLRERKGTAAIAWSIRPGTRIDLELVRMRHTPVEAVADWHLFGDDHWMTMNDPADPATVNGIGISLVKRPPYLGETSILGLILDLDAYAYGGSMLGGDREYGRLQADLWYTRRVLSQDAVQFRTSATLATGRAPRQALGDLGGDAGLKAFPPRGYDTPDTLIGTSRIFGRVEYRRAGCLMRRTRLPVIRDLNLRLVPFVEGGAVWGDGPILGFADLRGPKRHEYLWDVGFGLRRDLDLSGILSHVQVDFAWPMGQRRGPVRIGVTLSNIGLD